MKNLLFLVLAMFLFLGNSCQKEEIIPLEIENQEVVYTYQATLDENGTVFGVSAPIPTTCDCSLNVRANRNTTNISSDLNLDWTASAQLRNSLGGYSILRKVGYDGVDTYSSSDNLDGGPLGDWEHYLFTVDKGSELKLTLRGPNTNLGYANTTVYASISCTKASNGANTISINHTGQGSAGFVLGTVSNRCEALGGGM